MFNVKWVYLRRQVTLLLDDAFSSEPTRGPPKYAEEIEAERRRRLRADQHNTRSSRSIYQLQQQVSGVQTDIDGQTKSKVR